MTATVPVPAAGRSRFSILRVLLCGICLSALVAACLYIHHTAVSFYLERLLAEEKKHTAWIAEQISFALPWIVICLFQAIAYAKLDHRDGVARREMFWEVVLVTVFTYTVMLPYLNGLSQEMYDAAVAAGADIPETDGGVPWTLMMKLHDWFIRLAIPLALILTLHGMRARRESLAPDMPEVKLTLAEYEASLAAEASDAASAPLESTEEVSHHEGE